MLIGRLRGCRGGRFGASLLGFRTLPFSQDREEAFEIVEDLAAILWFESP